MLNVANYFEHYLEPVEPLGSNVSPSLGNTSRPVWYIPTRGFGKDRFRKDCRILVSSYAGVLIWLNMSGTGICQWLYTNEDKINILTNSIATVTLVRYSSKTVLPAFANCLKVLSNLHTLRIINAHPRITTTLKNSFQHMHYPQIQKVILPSCAHNILRACPKVRQVICNQDDGSKLITTMAGACKNAESLHYIHGGGLTLKRKLAEYTFLSWFPRWWFLPWLGRLNKGSTSVERVRGHHKWSVICNSTWPRFASRFLRVTTYPYKSSCLTRFVGWH